MNTNVFERRATEGASADMVSVVAYNLLIGTVLLWGFVLNWMIVRYVPPQAIEHINVWVFLGGYFASCLIGVYLFTKSTNPIVSFTGYNFVVIPFGLVLNVITSGFAPSLVLTAMRTTALVTMIMLVLGTLFPRFFAQIAGALTIALSVALVVELVEVFVFRIHHNILDWIVALIFCGYIGFDWGRAQQLPKTADNAIDSAAALYVDIINLLVRILASSDQGDD
jgi:FtsH-binding integral membrane protein